MSVSDDLLDKHKEALEEEVEAHVVEYFLDCLFGNWTDKEIDAVFKKVDKQVGKSHVNLVVLTLFAELLNRGRITLKANRFENYDENGNLICPEKKIFEGEIEAGADGRSMSLTVGGYDLDFFAKE